jgi:hypothetical protein
MGIQEDGTIFASSEGRSHVLKETGQPASQERMKHSPINGIIGHEADLFTTFGLGWGSTVMPLSNPCASKGAVVVISVPDC